MDSRLRISGMAKKGCHLWTPLSSPSPSFLNVSIRNLNYLRAKNLDSHLLVTPAIFKPFLACPWMLLSGVHGLKKYLDSRLNFGNNGARHAYGSQWKDKKKKQKRGFPIKTFGNDKKRGRHPWMFLRGVHSIWKPKKKQKLGFPIEDFGNDGRGGFPPKFQAWQKWETLEEWGW